MRRDDEVVDARVTVPPREIDAGPVTLRALSIGDASALLLAIRESLEHLRPWMPWATGERLTVADQEERINAIPDWELGEEHQYLMWADGIVVGSCGLHPRVGPGGIEIGYWVHVDHGGRGYAKATARALTAAALDLPHIERVEIHCDEANLRSAAVPRSLGYELDRIEEDGVTAPGEVGRSMIWVKGRDRRRLTAGS